MHDSVIALTQSTASLLLCIALAIGKCILTAFFLWKKKRTTHFIKNETVCVTSIIISKRDRQQKRKLVTQYDIQLTGRFAVTGCRNCSKMCRFITVFFPTILFLATGGICKVVFGPSSAAVMLGQTHELKCVVDEADNPTWDEVTADNNIIRLFTLSRRFNNNEKYSNFIISGTLPEYHLRIEAAQIEDEGRYSCSTTSRDVSNAMLTVEAHPSSVSISCNPSSCPEPTEDDFSDVICTCTSYGAYPANLQIGWTGATANTLKPTITNSSIGPNGTFDFTQWATANITGTTGIVECTLNGYVNAIVKPELKATYIYSSPMCKLTVDYDATCTDTSANLACSCSGSPEVGRYIFLSGDGEVIDGDVQNNARLNVPIEPKEKNTFYCKACNGVSFGGPSVGEVSIYTLDCNAWLKTVLIAVCCTETVVIIVVFVLFFIIHIVLNDLGKKEVQRHRKTLDSTPDETNAAYMDLQQIKQSSSNYVNLEVPFENISLQSTLPGKGFMEYYNAHLTLTQQNKEVVVKTVTDDAPVRLAKLQANEVGKVLALTTHVNIVQLVGCCKNAFPYLLCNEFVKGTILAEYLRENFQPHKIHQYGNTKRKRFHVEEKGQVEKLPEFALQIARGMNFLSAHNFVHPGLRSKKVILDMSGQCKLYDFLSEDNAKDIAAILWSKSVPYQWMPPEYLFLGKLGSSVDVWSFGVLIWEIFSYGAGPHAGKERSAVEKELREQQYLPIPSNCPGGIWQIALNCWEQSPEKRPTFEDLTGQMAYACNENKQYEKM